MQVLFGSTGLIGSVLQEHTTFDACFSSANFKDISSLDAIDHLFLCCLPATKWKVNQDPLMDLHNIFAIVDALSNLRVRRITLFSTIDIYVNCPMGMNEECLPALGKPSYGSNRFLFEQLVKLHTSHEKLQIIRLPALYHRLIKKNILFDLLHDHETEKINANSAFQWYPLSLLWSDLQDCEDSGIFNFFPAPIETSSILDEFFPHVATCYGPRMEYNHFTRHTLSGYWHWPSTVGENYSLLGDFIREARS